MLILGLSLMNRCEVKKRFQKIINNINNLKFLNSTRLSLYKYKVKYLFNIIRFKLNSDFKDLAY